ncbi:MAG: hypothetical protein IVW54_05355 [Candidatus Binataceae bacterium]|nr:hypothetical protein [Candidatus Binataceae bacterium]
MRQILSLLTAVAMATMIGGVALAQSGGGTSQVNGVVVNGNTTTVFRAANNSDLPMDSLTRWSSFAQRHPKMASQLDSRPMLINDAGYLRQHPELEKLFANHPDMLAQMKRDPGNFFASLPRSEEQ